MSNLNGLPRLLSNIPKGSWVALSHDASHVVSYDVELKAALRKARESGEDDPVVVRAGTFFSADTHVQLHGMSC
jgi:hypothetical protein